MEEAPRSPKPTQSLGCKSKANPSPTHLQFSRGCCRCRRAFQHVCPKTAVHKVYTGGSGSEHSVKGEQHRVGMNDAEDAGNFTGKLPLQPPEKSLPLRPSWGSHSMVACCDTLPLMYFYSLVILTWLCCRPPPPAVWTRRLVLPSGLRWGLPPSPADNNCHLHVAQQNKDLT